MKKYIVELTAEQREELSHMISTGKASARELSHARILLKADQDPYGPAWSDTRIKEALEISLGTVERTTPLHFGLYSLVTLFGQALHPDGHIPVAQAAWYRKQTATFCDVLAVVRRHLWGLLTFPTSPTDPGVVLLPSSTLERLSWAVCY